MKQAYLAEATAKLYKLEYISIRGTGDFLDCLLKESCQTKVTLNWV